jgi:hypothetical protein
VTLNLTLSVIQTQTQFVNELNELSECNEPILYNLKRNIFTN